MARGEIQPVVPARLWVPSLSEVHRQTGVPLRTLEKWSKSGKLEKTKRGWSVKAALDVLQDRMVPDEEPDGEALEELRRAKAEIAKLDLAQRRGELLETVLVQEALRTMANVFSSSLRALEAHAMEDCGLQGADLKLFAERLGARIDEVISTVNHTLGELEVMR